MNSDFRVGEWLVKPSLNLIESRGGLVHLEPKIMELLVYLVRHRMEVVSKECLIGEIWGNTFVTDQVLKNAIWKLREAFQDDVKNPKFIQTISRKGYRFIGLAPEEPEGVPESGQSAHPKSAWNWESPLPGIRPWALVALIVVLFLSLAISATMKFWPVKEEPKTRAMPFDQRDWLLMAQFENRSGDPLLDGTVAYALEREISNSQFVNIVPRERMQDTLRLMKKPLDAPVDEILGREICLRDGGIRALLSGRVDQMGTKYVLSVKLIDPAKDVTVAGLSQEAESQEELLAAIHQIANQIRKTLGEALAPMKQSDDRLEKVITPSLRALLLYSKAIAISYPWQGDPQRWVAVAELLKQAVAEDPEFASAHMMLAWSLRNSGEPETHWQPHRQQAYRLASKTTELERLFILGSYHYMVGDNERALPFFQALVRLKPDHYWGTHKLISILYRLGQRLHALPHVLRLARLRPNDLPINLEAAVALSTLGADPAAAEPFLKKVGQLLSDQPDQQTPTRLVNLELFRVRRNWLDGDIDKASADLDDLTVTIPRYPTPETAVWGTVLIGRHHLTLGRLDEARKNFTAVLPRRPVVGNVYLAVTAFLGRDAHALRRYLMRCAQSLREQGVAGEAISVMLMARTGLLKEAQSVMPLLSRLPGHRLLGEGELSLARGDLDKAQRLLEEGVTQFKATGFPEYFLAVDALASVFERQGNTEAAVGVLEEASREKLRAAYRDSGFFWVRNEWRRAKLYQKLGQRQQARAIEEVLLQHLTRADPDYPILVQLKQSRQSPQPSLTP